MGRRVIELAQDIQDLYLQDFADDNETFFSDISFFVRQVQDAYAALLSEEYKARYAELRGEGAHRINLVEFDSLWMKRETTTFKKEEESGYYVAKLTHPIMSFAYDNSTVGLQGIRAKKRDGCKLIRTTASEVWMDNLLPRTNVVFYWGEDGKVWADKPCCGDVIVSYVAVPDEEMELDSSKADEIKKRVLNLMLAAKQGNEIVDQTDDSNPNKIMASEIDQAEVTN